MAQAGTAGKAGKAGAPGASGTAAIPYTHMTHDEAFELFDNVARGLACTLGPTCETLVQELTETGCCTVLSIYNGQISGRQVGSTLSIYGEDTAHGAKWNVLDLLDADAVVGLQARTADGKRVKSSSWLVRGEGYLLLLGVNMDVTTVSVAADVLVGLAMAGDDLRKSLTVREEGPQDADSLIDEALNTIARPVESYSRSDRIEVVRLLRDRGFFDYQHAAATLAARLGVSRNTIYNDLQALRREG